LNPLPTFFPASISDALQHMVRDELCEGAHPVGPTAAPGVEARPRRAGAPRAERWSLWTRRTVATLKTSSWPTRRLKLTVRQLKSRLAP
jgi:hypothetical protein